MLLHETTCFRLCKAFRCHSLHSCRLQDYMNYRKYKYLRLDGSSTIVERREMVKEFQQK